MCQINNLKGALSTLLLLLGPLQTKSVPASPHGMIQQQPDGSRTSVLFINGDHRMNYVTDENGYTVIQDENEWFVYADKNVNGNLIPTKYKAGSIDPNEQQYNLKKGLKPNHQIRRVLQEMNEFQTLSNKKKSGLRGGKKEKSEKRILSSIRDTESLADGAKVMQNVVLLIRFSDHENRTLPTKDEINTLMNHDGEIPGILPTGSVADVYKKNSFGKLILESDVLDWVTISKSEQECADGVNGFSDQLVLCIREALDLYSQNGIQFSDWDEDGDGEFDVITVLHSGYGAEWGFTDCYNQNKNDRIWSHKWTMPTRLHWTSKNDNPVTFNKYHITSALWGRCGSEKSRIAAIAHETGHFLDLPDLYDLDGSGYGIGNYDMMANMWGWNNDQYYPPTMSCWTKAHAGWVEPIELFSDGTYSLPNAAENPMCYKITKGFPLNEYLLIENRYATGYDQMIPGEGGLAVWHIDENAGYNVEGYPEQQNFPENGKHYKVSLLQADGLYSLERKVNKGDLGDLYREGDEIASKGVFPSTQSYQNGKILDTNIKIYNITAPSAEMSFAISFTDDDHLEIDTINDLNNAQSFVLNQKEKNDDFSEDIKGELDLSAYIIQNDNLNPKKAICSDDDEYFFKKADQNCKWVGEKKQCNKCHKNTCAKDFCQKTCGMCESD